ncbi:MAG: glycosyltransferase [Lachnospiraceae bacterium]|jgi:glycosyltransferase involved in cell wall biosynthesis|nr:glycosyltransferase [uncultured Acetatifactor sp.]MCI9218163.1 glycosyltransferase [Lachnospiraceae bacterium]
MRIGIILTNLYPGKIGGAEQYVRNTIHEMAYMNGLSIYVFVNNTAFTTFKTEGCAKVIKIEDSENRDTQLRFWIDYKNIDIMFCPLFFIAPENCPIPAVASILDVQHEFFPQYFSKKVLADIRKSTADTLAQADGIITISEYSKQTIIDKYHIKEDKICVTYLNSDGVFDLPLEDTKKEELRKRINADYIFYPANSWPHKNHLNLLKAYSILKEKYHSRLKLVFTGDGKQRKKDIDEYIVCNNLEKDIIYLGYLPQNEMPYIFANATVMAFPSVFEGFGIPLVEAMKAKVAVACSKCGSIPEVAEDAALYFDAYAPEDIAAKLHQLETDAELRNQLIQKGERVAQKYSWRKCAEDTVLYLEKIWRKNKTDTTDKYGDLPLVSVITPSYNQGEFIKATIDSVLNQDYPNIEYLVMDGGSTDNTVEVLKSYGNRIQWVSEKDLGQADAVNKGIRRAKGQIIGWLNSDDTYLESAISKMVSYMKTHPDTDMVYGEGYYTDKEGNVVERYLTEKYDVQRLAEMCIICQPTAFFTKEIVEKAGMLDVEHQLSMDYELWMRMAKLGKIAYIPEYIATSRMYEENKTLSRRKEVFEETCKAVKKHYNYVPISWIDGYADYLAAGSRGLKFQWNDFRLFIKYNYTNPSYLRNGLKVMLKSRYGGLVKVRKLTQKAVAYTEQYPDLWLAKSYIRKLALNGKHNVIELKGTHNWSLKRDLEIKVFFDGEKVDKLTIKELGPFSKVIEIPAGKQKAGEHLLKLSMNATFCPARIAKSKDERELSFILNDIKLGVRK